MLSFAYKRCDGVVPEPRALHGEDQTLLEEVEASSEGGAALLTRR
jgi:hypothetical protein